MHGWTPERRQRQSELIRTWRPWEQSTGPRSPEGKEKASMNPWRGGHRAKLRDLTRMLNAEIEQSRNLVAVCR